MSVQTTTHLNFRGDARAALDFYRSVFGGEQMIVTYEDAGQVEEPAQARQVMWGQVASEQGFRVMAYDVPSRMPWNPGENAVFVSVRGTDADEVRAYWDKLSANASLVRPLAPAPWAPLYGMLKDRFGITWILYASAEPHEA